MSLLTIYDFGANNGDDVPYYLMKADRVVCVEANPQLCEQIRNRFRSAVDEGRLIVENCVLVDNEHSGQAHFFIHRRDHVLSTASEPSADTLEQYNKVALPSRTPAGIVESYGEPYYMKIDIEGYDTKILESLFRCGVRPPWISAESHTIETFALLVSIGKYNAFKLVDGRSVAEVYSRRTVKRRRENDSVVYSFPYHSAGPFGNDIDGQWMTADAFLRVLALEGLGWKDIHATSVENADTRTKTIAVDYVVQAADRVFSGRQLICVSLSVGRLALLRAVRKLYRVCRKVIRSDTNT